MNEANIKRIKTTLTEATEKKTINITPWPNDRL
jgi:hypothetical protein